MMQASPPTAAARFICGIAAYFNYLAVACVIVIVSSTVFDVFLRYFFDAPTTWANEISTYALVMAVFFGTAQTQLDEGNVRIDLLLAQVSSSTRQTLLLISAWIGLLFTLIAGWQTALMVISDYSNNSRLMGMLLTPSWLPKFPIAVGLMALAAALLVEIERISGKEKGRNQPYFIMGLLIVALIFLGVTPRFLPGTHFDLGSLAVLLAVLCGAASSGPKVLSGVLATVIVGSSAMYFGMQTGLWFVTLMMGLMIIATLAIGVRIAFSLGLLGLLSIYFLSPVPFPINIPGRIWGATNSFALIAVPMFVLMGAILIRSGLSRELFAVMARWLSRLPGGLVHASIAGCGVFAAVSGSSVATAATMGAAACPEMIRRNYSPGLAYGSIAAGGTLGILIPPSVPMIIYGITVGVPITALFIAGIVPGILMMLAFSAVAIIWSLIYPSAAPCNATLDEPLTRRSYIDTMLLMLLILLVILALYGGIATPSETGALGAFLALLICWVRGRMTVQNLLAALKETVAVTSFILLIVVAANILTFGFDYLKISQALMSSATSGHLGRWEILLIVMAVYVVLGMFLDSISMMVLTLPIVFPLIVLLGFDPVWFGIIVVIMAELGLVTPPVGLNLFVLQGIDRNISIRTIALGTVPFILAMLAIVALLCVYPQIALWLTTNLK